MKHGRQTRQQEKQEGSATKKKEPDFWARNTIGGWREGKGTRAGVFGEIQTV